MTNLASKLNTADRKQLLEVLELMVLASTNKCPIPQPPDEDVPGYKLLIKKLRDYSKLTPNEFHEFLQENGLNVFYFPTLKDILNIKPGGAGMAKRIQYAQGGTQQFRTVYARFLSEHYKPDSELDPMEDDFRD